MRPGLRSLLLVAIGSVLLSGCSSSGSGGGASSSTSVKPSGLIAPSGFRSVILKVTRADGVVEEHCVWLADDETSRENGLMGVTDPTLGGRSGMVFRFPDDTTAPFWMKDTVLPLSIAWFAADGSFVSSRDMEPCPSDGRMCATYAASGPYRLALEVPKGELPGLGVDDRSKVRLGGSCG